MINNPLVSIVIPVYNGHDYLKIAIDSALSQTYKNTEVLVINDGSTDDTQEIALSYGDKIRYFYKENGGVSSALNLGIKEMKGEYFSWLSHDDVYLPNKVENQVNLLLKHNALNSLALCSTVHIDKDGKELNISDKRKLNENKLLSWQTPLYDVLMNGSYNGCAFLIPKKAFEVCGGFDESLRYSQDVLMWAKIFANEFSLVYEVSPDVLHRIHSKQLTQTGRALFMSDGVKSSDELIPLLGSKRCESLNFLYAYAHRAAFNGNAVVVKRCIKYGESRFTVADKLTLRFTLLYGKIRPTLRHVYYYLFRRINTE